RRWDPTTPDPSVAPEAEDAASEPRQPKPAPVQLLLSPLETRVTALGRTLTGFEFRWKWTPPLLDATSLVETPNGEQGLRVYVWNDQPIAYEVHHDTSGQRVFYVLSRVEEEARKAFGDPLPGRKFSVEPGAGERPEITVARVLADGPMPMGPWIYLDRTRGNVVTLLCRCEASQTNGNLRNREYNVVNQLPRLSSVREKLEDSLRLPESFFRTR
ncbi:MAG: hypothetical protein AAF517_09605, partial [Planctomycetota bacterium]